MQFFIINWTDKVKLLAEEFRNKFLTEGVFIFTEHIFESHFHCRVSEFDYHLYVITERYNQSSDIPSNFSWAPTRDCNNRYALLTKSEFKFYCHKNSVPAVREIRKKLMTDDYNRFSSYHDDKEERENKEWGWKI